MSCDIELEQAIDGLSTILEASGAKAGALTGFHPEQLGGMALVWLRKMAEADTGFAASLKSAWRDLAAIGQRELDCDDFQKPAIQQEFVKRCEAWLQTLMDRIEGMDHCDVCRGFAIQPMVVCDCLLSGAETAAVAIMPSQAEPGLLWCRARCETGHSESDLKVVCLDCVRRKRLLRQAKTLKPNGVRP